jgi:hypothetical protein
MAISLTKPVFLRFSRGSWRVICFQGHSMFRQEAVRVCEQSKFWRFRTRRGMYPALVSIGSKSPSKLRSRYLN